MWLTGYVILKYNRRSSKCKNTVCSVFVCTVFEIVQSHALAVMLHSQYGYDFCFIN